MLAGGPGGIYVKRSIMSRKDAQMRTAILFLILITLLINPSNPRIAGLDSVVH